MSTYANRDFPLDLIWPAGYWKELESFRLFQHPLFVQIIGSDFFKVFEVNTALYGSG